MEPMPNFRLLRPASVADAVAARAGAVGARFLAGGTDLIPNMRRGLVAAETLIDLRGVTELRRLDADANGLLIGAGVTLEALANHPVVRKDYPGIAEAAESIAGPTHRAAGTVGGNLCLDTRCRYYNQSDAWRSANDFCMKAAGDTCRVAPNSNRCFAAFSGDLAPVLMALGAVADIAGPAGTRQMPLAEVYAEDDGMAYLTLASDELLVAIRVGAGAGRRSGYEKLRVRNSVEFPLAGVAVSLRREGDSVVDLRIAVTGADSRPILLTGTDGAWKMDAADEARIAKLLRKQTAPMETTLTLAAYRRRVLPVMTTRLIKRLFAAA